MEFETERIVVKCILKYQIFQNVNNTHLINEAFKRLKY